ncbi:MAG: nucleotidyltransferase domain-containing protein [Lachnospiraceae bacterium]|nr:nucleotidyltransferase domain-containing protein [Lachnospiraceae bacterium]
MCDINQAKDIFKKAYTANEQILGEIKDAYLYGSYARGDFNDESDVDIILFVPLSQEEISEYRKEISKISSRLSLEHDVTVSVMVEPVDQLVRYAEILPFYQNIIREGIKYAG